MKKRYTAMIAAMTLMYVLAGCGGKSDSAKETTAEVKSTEAVQSEADEATEELGELIKEDEKEAKLLHAKIISDGKYGSVDNGESSVNFNTTTAGVILNDEEAEEYPLLAKALNDEFEENKRMSEKDFEDLRDSAASILEYGGSGDYMQLIAENSASVVRADETVLSYLIDYTDFYGGAHGNYASLGRSFDTETGKKLSIYDVISDKETFSKALEAELTKRYADDGGLIENNTPAQAVETFFEYISSEDSSDSVSWTIGNDRLNIYFNPYSIASYAFGEADISLMFSEYPGVVKDIYTDNASDSYAVKIKGYDGYLADINNTGEYVNVAANYGTYDEFCYESLDIVVTDDNGQSTTKSCDAHYFDFYTYYVKIGYRHYLHIFASSENDFTGNYIYEITGGDIKDCGYYGVCPARISYEYTEDGDIWMNSETTAAYSDPAKLQLSVRLDALSTYNAWRYYSINALGIPESDELYRITADYISPKLKKGITAAIADANGKKTGEKVDIPAGTALHFYMTDGESFVIFSLDDGRYIAVDFDSSDWPYTVEGEPMDEVLEDYVFAG